MQLQNFSLGFCILIDEENEKYIVLNICTSVRKKKNVKRPNFSEISNTVVTEGYIYHFRHYTSTLHKISTV